MAEKKERPLTREDVLKLIGDNGGTAEGLDLSGREFQKGINLRKLNLRMINLSGANLLEADLQETNLRRAQLQGACLHSAHLERANLWRTRLDGANLREARLDGANLHSAVLEKANLSAAHLETADLTNANLEEANLSSTYLRKTNLTSAYLRWTNLYNVKIFPDTQLQHVNWGNYILGEERRGKFLLAEETYRQLKAWYASAGIYDISGEFTYRELTARRKAYWFSKGRTSELLSPDNEQLTKPVKKLLHPLKPKEVLKAIFPRKPFQWVFSMLLNVLCGYGERPARVLISATVVVFSLAAVYYLFGGLTLPYSLYFSVVSFVALGYGSWAYAPPHDWVKGLGAAECVTGVFMMSLFVVTFVRKWTR